MGHYGKFGCALWAAAMNLVYAMGHCGKFGYALWATARNEAIKYKSVTISPPWVTAQDLVMRYGP
jgi:hypothetical protein